MPAELAGRDSGGIGLHPREPFRPRLWRWLPIARTGIALVLERKLFRFFLLLGLANFLFYSSIIYFLAQLEAELSRHEGVPPGMARFARNFAFTGSGSSYRDFIFGQNIVVMLFLAFAGSILAGNDFRFRAVAFYLSKPISKLEYFLGKLGAAACLTMLLTLVPALILFIEYGAFTGSLDYFLSSQRILWAIAGYGLLVSVASSVLLLGVAALLERTIPIVAVWGALFIFLPAVAAMLRGLAGERGADAWGWALLDFWALLRWTSGFFFGIHEEVYSARLPWALLALGAWLSLAVYVFFRRVRAVEVVR
jgi:ABC-2 type transport system permease protein